MHLDSCLSMMLSSMSELVLHIMRLEEAVMPEMLGSIETPGSQCSHAEKEKS